MDTNFIDSAPAQTVYMVRFIDSERWLPMPFGSRALAHTWAKSCGFKDDAYDVSGFRIRNKMNEVE